MTNRNLGFIVKEQHPLMLSSTTSIKEAAACMAQRRVGAVLVTDASRHLVGIFTGRDAVRVLGDGCDAALATLATVMTPDPKALGPEATAIDALRAMVAGGYRHVPIIAEGKILGIVSRSDFQGLELDRLEEEVALWERMG